jgi:signal peptidase I
MKKNTTNKIIKISLNTIFYLIIVGLLVFSIMTIRSKKANSIPNIFGRG